MTLTLSIGINNPLHSQPALLSTEEQEPSVWNDTGIWNDEDNWNDDANWHDGQP